MRGLVEIKNYVTPSHHCAARNAGHPAALIATRASKRPTRRGKSGEAVRAQYSARHLRRVHAVLRHQPRLHQIERIDHELKMSPVSPPTRNSADHVVGATRRNASLDPKKAPLPTTFSARVMDAPRPNCQGLENRPRNTLLLLLLPLLPLKGKWLCTRTRQISNGLCTTVTATPEAAPARTQPPMLLAAFSDVKCGFSDWYVENMITE